MNLTTKTVQKMKKDNVCAICIAPYKPGEKVFFLKCKHHFHTNCVGKWFEKNHICPTCRMNVNTGTYEKEEKGNDQDEQELDEIY